MTKNKYKLEKVVVGGNLSSFLYSYINNLPLIITSLKPPHRFETIGSDSSLELWEKLYFLLSLSGLNFVGDKAQYARIKDDRILSVTAVNSSLIEIEFDKLIIFDDENISGLPVSVEELSKTKNKLLVLDWMVARPCMEHDFEYFCTDDEFVKHIYFYPTERMTGLHPRKKDVVAISYLTREQLQEFEYSDTYARFKTTSIMKDNGITGRKNGYSGGKQIHYALKLEVERREIRSIRMNLYDNTENLYFNYSSAQDIINEKTVNESYQDKLNKYFKVI